MRTKTAVLALAVLVLATGCRTTGLPPNTDPSCRDCSRIVPSGREDFCTSEPVAGSERPKNLVFEGGGVKGIAYAGVLGALGDERLADVEKVAGTSAGAITAMIVSMGYTAREMCDITLGTDFKSLEDGSFPGDVKRLLERFGWFRGDVALCLLECLVEKRTGSRKTTFAELHELRRKDPAFKDLFVFGTDVSNQQSVEFSHRNPLTRDVPIADAVRISMSFPFVFAARKFDGDVFVDGGALRNYPIQAFDGDMANLETLGFALGAEPPKEQIDDLREFGHQMFKLLLNVQTAALCDNPSDVERTVFIDTQEVSSTDFGLSHAQKLELAREGREVTEAYLKAPTHSSKCPTFVLPLPLRNP